MADAENHRPGEPPEIRDEAADTPMWLPVLGLALLVFAAVGVIYQSVQAEAEVDETIEVAEDGDAADEDAEAEVAEEDAPAAE
ncbi:MAG: hypothetical protein AB8I08_10995 [Sandaracinaceae bacterium]